MCWSLFKNKYGWLLAAIVDQIKLDRVCLRSLLSKFSRLRLCAGRSSLGIPNALCLTADQDSLE